MGWRISSLACLLSVVVALTPGCLSDRERLERARLEALKQEGPPRSLKQAEPPPGRQKQPVRDSGPQPGTRNGVGVNR